MKVYFLNKTENKTQCLVNKFQNKIVTWNDDDDWIINSFDEMKVQFLNKAKNITQYLAC